MRRLAVLAVLVSTGVIVGLCTESVADICAGTAGLGFLWGLVLIAAAAGIAWAGHHLGAETRRVVMFMGVVTATLILLFLHNKKLVGERAQDLRAEVRSDESALTFRVAFKDLAGRPVEQIGDQRDALLRTLKGDDERAEIAVKSVGEPLSSHEIPVTLASAKDAAALRSRLIHAAFKRKNPPRPLFDITQGIDLQGGVEFICQLYKDGVRREADSEVVAILRTRLDERGLTEPTVSRLSNGDVQVVIPGGTAADAARTRRVLETTGRLEFREVLRTFPNQEYPSTKPGDEKCAVIAKPDGTYKLAPGVGIRGDMAAADRSKDPDFVPQRWYHLGPAALSGRDVADAGRTIHQGKDAVSITFTASGATKNLAFTSALKAKRDADPRNEDTGRLAIVFDDRVESAPVVREPSSVQCVISGQFTPDEIDSLRSALRGGALAVTPVVISERHVGATLGADTVRRTYLTMLGAFIGILVFMAVYYRRLGLVAVCCLLTCGALTWTTLSIFGATITLPGLAGLLLSIAMSMDTNVLIYERIREELKKGLDLRDAVAGGYNGAFWAIFDSNMTTVVAGMILYFVGSGTVKGFGLTLSLGVAISMFSGLYLGRLLTDLVCRGRLTVSMANLVPEWRLPYIGWRKISYTLSIITGVLGVGWFAFGHQITGGRFNDNFDIDFTGGNQVQVLLSEAQTSDQVHAALDAAFAKDPVGNDLLKPQELAPPSAYYATITSGGASRQWVFRGRDVKAAQLEGEREALENERGELQRDIDELREQKGMETQLKEPLKRLETLKTGIESLQKSIAERTTDFRRQIAGAFAGKVPEEGSEVLGAQWQDATVTLRLATLDAPSQAQADAVRETLRRNDEIATLTVRALSVPQAGLEIQATYRQRPGPAAGWTNPDPAARRLLLLLAPPAAPAEAGKPVLDDDAKRLAADTGLAATAFDLYGKVITATAKHAVVVTQPFPASEHFSGQVAGQMKFKAFLALLIATVAMLAYIAARFELGFGIGAVVALFHDLLLTLGLISLLGIRIDLTVVAALLTVIGYSVNDTIVNFDRIRENLRLMANASLAEIIDRSVAQTIPRTVLTGGAALLAMLAMIFFAGDAIYSFSVTLFIGTIFGTYSSVFVAAPLLLFFDRRKLITEEKKDDELPAGGEAVVVQ